MKLPRLPTNRLPRLAPLRTPAASLAIALTLLASLAWISRADWWDNDSTVGAFVNRQFNTKAVTTDWWGLVHNLRSVIWIDGVATVLDDDHQNRVAMADEHYSAGRPVVYLWWKQGVHRRGLWALTREIEYQSIREMSLNGPTPGQLAEARRLYAATDPQYAAVADGDIEHVRILWVGVALDAMTLLAFFASIYSLAWIPRWAVHRRARRRLAAGLCPNCRYDLAGVTGVCPECGHERVPSAP